MLLISVLSIINWIEKEIVENLALQIYFTVFIFTEHNES